MRDYAVAMALTLLGGCVTPLLHPIRSPDGLYARVAVGAGGGSGPSASCYEVCRREPFGAIIVAPSAAVGLGIRHSASHGLLVGLTLSTGSEEKFGDQGLSDAVAVNLWTDWTAGAWTVGVGPALSLNSVTPELGLHAHLFGDQRHEGVSVWGRAMIPWRARADIAYGIDTPQPFAEVPDGADFERVQGMSTAVQAGASVTWRRLGVHYALTRRVRGLITLPIYVEGVDYVSWVHVVSVSYTFRRRVGGR